ncbi:hypothetical protein IB244_23550 [Rhizobium sp. RHZ02]|uniref:2-keto-4-pentenoate hydratase n=1 Tax=Rhizobium sp. RHZ02 TaxID=2769306 RepID=UPI001786782F|nr:hypothetical protein [Rhizobium sp. RHZ02]MBD9454480.1 hypothetical protein [Rhizobium sp. RHZ02]
MNSDLILRASHILAKATAGERITDLPEDLVPLSVDTAYAIQDATLVGQQIGGWKVAPAAAGQVPRCSPIAASRFVKNGSALPAGLHAPEVEVEVAFKLSKDLPVASSRADVSAAVGSLHVALEILDSRFVDRRQVSALTALADGQSNCLVVAGDGIDGVQDFDSAGLAPVLKMGGTQYEVTKTLPDSGGVLDAVLWLANHAAARGQPLRTGQIIITGARVGPVPIAANSSLDATLSGVGHVSLAAASIA